jgi:formylglycine-generating enzyme required for sulfatase activity/serine/threonine protein kinase
MPKAAPCPDPTQYKKLASGELLSPERDAVLEHLEGCDACATWVEGLAENDTLVELIRQASALGQPSGGETVDSLVERFRKLRPGDEGAREAENVAPGESGPEPRLTFACPSCGKGVRVTAKSAGKKAKCPHCKEVVRVPEQAARSSQPAKFDFLAPPQAPDEMGRLGPYRVLGVLGEGGMGVVFRAEDPELGRPVALKAMLPKIAVAATGRDRFLREARSMAAIKHDHIVSIYQVGEDRGVPFLAMEFLEGESLEKCLRRERKLPVTEVIRIGYQIACALAAAHDRGLIHRDIKPANLWLEDRGEQGGSPARGRLKMLDFGLARAVEEGSGITQSGQIVGTPEYSAPEQVEAKALDHRCDLFSLGCVLYRMTTGKSPFKRAHLMATLMAVSHKDPPPPGALEPTVPLALSKLIMHLLAKEPAKRPESAHDVAEALERLAWKGTSRTASRMTEKWSTAVRRKIVHLPVAMKKRWRIGAGVATCVLLVGLAFLGAGDVFRVKTKDGILVVSVNEPYADVYVDGEKVTVTWKTGGKSAEIKVKPGTRNIEVKKDGFTVEGEEITFAEGARERLRVKLDKLPPPPPHDFAQREEPAPAPKETPKPKPAERERRVEPAPEIANNIITNSIGMKLAYIKPGTFLMGSPRDEIERREDEEQHEVEITHPFYLGVYDVTQAQYEKVMGKNPSDFTNLNRGGPDHPVQQVTWHDAVEFCKKLSALAEERAAARAYRLPTEAEWEYACRGGTQTAFHYGNSLSSRQANFAGHRPYGGAENGPWLRSTTPVASYKPNDFGLCDMHGNVWQWCADWYDKDYYKNSPKQDPQGPSSGSGRVIRGGSWRTGAGENCRSAARAADVPSEPSVHHSGGIVPNGGDLGFRVVMVPSAHDAGITNTPAKTEVAPPNRLPELTLDLGDGVKMEFARIPAGEFMMGDPDSEPLQFENTRPYHRVRISKDFNMGKYLVTQEQYEKIMGKNPSYFSASGGEKSRVEGLDTRRFPVEGVSWHDAQEFCRKLSERSRHRCTLPTEAQWEYACRAGTTTLFHFGTSCNGKEANCNGNHPYGTPEKGPNLGRTCAVGSYPANAFGLHDMHGNVWEWCADYHGNGNYKYHETVDPIGRLARENWRVLRGGPWDADAVGVRAAIRYGWDGSNPARNIGFRVICVE